jgi:hypothetical protein
VRAAAIAIAVCFTMAAPAAAQGPFGPLNDLAALGQGEGQTPDAVPVQKNPEPPFRATPRATCGPGDRPEPGIQGRVPADSATDGLRCNVTQVAHQGNSGGFRVWRYIDTKGHECAFYDTSLLFPLSALRFDFDSPGVAVLDMSDPSNPKQTDTLTELPMLSPHESLNLNTKRGLLAAVLGNPATYPGLVSVYDASQDCRHPKLRSTQLLARYGHESGFSTDGKTFYAAGTGTQSITAIDVTDPTAPFPVWQGNVLSHGMSLSPDGNRLYVADALGGNMAILDVSEIQARKENPQVREVSRVTWTNATIPQNAIPFTKHGHRYVLEFDEYSSGDEVGAAHIIDIGDETQPRVVANLRLQVNQPKEHAEAANDPGAFSPVQGYGAHYCNIPTRVDPNVVACSFINSGLRVFDISKIRKPKEIAYFVSPTRSRAENGTQASDFAMSQPAIIPKRHEVWYTDGTTGFYVLRVDKAVWPRTPKTIVRRHPGRRHRCRSRRSFAVHVRLPAGSRASAIRARLGGRRVKARQRGGYVRLRANLRRFGKRTVRLKVRVKLADGRTLRDVRTYHPCTS